MAFLEKRSSDPQLVEVYDAKPSSEGTDEYEPTFDRARTRNLLRKMDVNIVPFLALLYLYAFSCLPHIFAYTSLDRLSFLDRSNIGNARLVGLEKNLGMKGLDYNVI
jgi:hypothetical protein